MIVKDLILAHTPKEVYPVYNETYGDLNIPDIGNKNRRTCFFDMYKRLREVEPVISENIVLGSKSTSGDRKYINTSFYGDGLLEREFKPKKIIDALTPKNVAELSTELIFRLALETEFCCPSAHNPTSLSWSNFLGYTVSEENLRAVGELQILARLMFDLSVLGFTEEDIEARRSEIMQEIADEMEFESDEDSECDDAAMADIIDFNRFIGSEEDDDDDGNDSDDDDEDDFDYYNDIELHRPQHIESLFNSLAKYNAIKAYCSEQR